MNRADRKKQLIAQGTLYRAEVMLAKQAVQDGLQPQSLARGALQHIVSAAFSVIRNRTGTSLPGANLRMVLPLATGVFSFLSKRKSLRRALGRGALFAGVAASVVALLSARKACTASDEPE